MAAILAAITIPSACSRVLGDPAAQTEAGWVLDPADNVCGLSDPRMLSNPSRVAYPQLLAATPEMRRIAAEGIDPNSSRGVVLRQQAVDRVIQAADFVRAREGYCSVWKQIRHRDGRLVPDISEAVRARFPRPDSPALDVSAK